MAWIVLGAALSSFPAVLIAEYTRSHRPWLIVISLLMYAALIYVYIQLFNRSSVGVMYMILKVLSSLLVLGLAIVWFKERLSLIQLIGIVLAILAIILLSLNRK
jgi:multidrug transporter EmrE-like cation transporter